MSDILDFVNLLEEALDEFFPKHRHKEKFKSLRAALQPKQFDVEALKQMALTEFMKGREHNKDLREIAFEIISETFNVLKIKGHLTAQPEWLDIDELPDEDDIVIVCWPNGYWQQAKFMEGDFWFETKGRGNHLVNKIGFTHWHKPTPPKQEGE